MVKMHGMHMIVMAWLSRVGENDNAKSYRSTVWIEQVQEQCVGI